MIYFPFSDIRILTVLVALGHCQSNDDMLRPPARAACAIAAAARLAYLPRPATAPRYPTAQAPAASRLFSASPRASAVGTRRAVKGMQGTHHRIDTKAVPLFDESLPPCPPYPYPPAPQHLRDLNSGLFGSQRVRSGNCKTTEKAPRHRRSWNLNIHERRLWSMALQRFFKVRFTARILRTIDKCGGLDEYVLGSKPTRIRQLGVYGWQLRWRVLCALREKEAGKAAAVEAATAAAAEAEAGIQP